MSFHLIKHFKPMDRATSGTIFIIYRSSCMVSYASYALMEKRHQLTYRYG